MERGRIPNRLKQYRSLAGYSLKEVAELLDLKNPTSVGGWEKGITLPNLAQIFKLSVLYRTHPLHLYQEFWQYVKEDMLQRDFNRNAQPEQITRDEIIMK